jgi:hypothetical protein
MVINDLDFRLIVGTRMHVVSRIILSSDCACLHCLIVMSHKLAKSHSLDPPHALAQWLTHSLMCWNEVQGMVGDSDLPRQC